MGGFTLPQVAISAILGGSGQPNVLGGPAGANVATGPGGSLLIPQGDCEDAVRKLIGGDPRFFAYGHTGGTTLVAYSPAVDMTIAVDLTDSLWDNGRYDAVVELMSLIGGLIAATPH